MKMTSLYFSVFFLSFILLTACGTSQEEESAPPTETNTPTEVSYTGEVRENASLQYKQFDLDIDYVDSLSYRVEYVANNNGIQASINDLDNQEIAGKEAVNQLSTRFQKLSFDSKSPTQQVIREVIHAFDLDETFKEFELDVTFADGARREYEQ